MRRLPGRVPHADPDGAAKDKRDEQRQHGRVRRHQVRDAVHEERDEDGVSPARPPAEADDGNVRGECRQVTVERHSSGETAASHCEGGIEVRGGGQPQERICGQDHSERDRGGEHGLGEPMRLAAGQLADGQCHRQDQQRQGRREAEQGEQGARQPVSRRADVGFRARHGRECHQARAGQQSNRDAAGNEAQQIDGPADPALEVVVGHQHRGRRLGAGCRRPGGGHRATGRNRAGAAVRRRDSSRPRHLPIVSPGKPSRTATLDRRAGRSVRTEHLLNGSAGVTTLNARIRPGRRCARRVAAVAMSCPGPGAVAAASPGATSAKMVSPRLTSRGAWAQCCVRWMTPRSDRPASPS